MTECGPTRESKPLAALWRLGCFVRAAIHPAVAGRDSPRIGVRHETTAKTSPELGATGRPPVSTGTAAPPLGRGKPTPSWRNRPNPQNIRNHMIRIYTDAPSKTLASKETILSLSMCGALFLPKKMDWTPNFSREPPHDSTRLYTRFEHSLRDTKQSLRQLHS